MPHPLHRRFAAIKIRYLWYLLLPLLVLGLRENGTIAQLNRYGFDRLLTLRPPEAIDNRVVIVAIDAQDLQQEPDRTTVSDRHLAQVINRLAAAQPSAIGVDIVRDGAIDPLLQAAYQNHPTVIGLTSIQQEIAAPLGVTADRAGFGDYEPDEDSLVRRALLANFKSNPQYSLAFLVAQRYLQQQGKPMKISPERLELGGQSIPPLATGSRDETFETTINYRHIYPSFPQISWTDVLNGKIPNLRKKVVLIGYTASTRQDFVNTSVFFDTATKVKGNITGVEYHAHIASQLMATGLGERALIQPVPLWGDYLWILLCMVGSGSILKIIQFKTPFWILLIVFLAYTTGVCLGIYLLFLAGWWLPIGLTAIILVVNIPLLLSLYQREQSIMAIADQRQQAITEAFNAIHNGPLQELSLLRQATQSRNLPLPEISNRLARLNQQIRQIGESLQADGTKGDRDMLVLGNGERLDLKMPLNELLHLVADRTLYTDRYPILASLKVKIINFQEISLENNLTLDQKRQLCQFLEEAIGNVGKYAVGATRLQLVGKAEGNHYSLSIEDNGKGQISNRVGTGTKQAQQLATALKGEFSRHQNNTGTGVCCAIEWQLHRKI
jgi:CHASE2 domain-containing sensor protein